MHVVAVKPEQIFQALADPTRIRIARLLFATGEETCLCELVDSLREPQHKLSRHLTVLRQAGLLTSDKEGRWVYHRMVRGTPITERLCDLVCSLPDRDNAFAGDLALFRDRMRLREDGRCRVGIQTPDLAAGAE